MHVERKTQRALKEVLGFDCDGGRHDVVTKQYDYINTEK